MRGWTACQRADLGITIQVITYINRGGIGLLPMTMTPIYVYALV